MAFEVKIPQLGLTMEEGTVGNWLKNEGDVIKVGDPLVEIETDKLTNIIESEQEGVLLKIIAQQGMEVPVQGVIAYIGEAGEIVGNETAAAEPSEVTDSSVAVSEVCAPLAASATDTTPLPAGGRIKISPLAKKTAAKLGIDYTMLSGSGSGGRIVQKDIINAEAATGFSAPAAAVDDLLQTAAPPSGNMGLELMEGDEVIRLSSMRKTVAHRMFKSHSEIPSVTTNAKVDVTKLMALRKQLNAEMERKYSVNDFILKATAKALQKNRSMLAAWNGDSIIKRAHINLGMAVALDVGLIVPVIFDADKMGLDMISDKAKDLAERARSGELNPEEYQNSTFSISNVGMMGVESFTPVINQPDMAILGVCAIQDELDMDDDGKLFKKKVMRTSLTWDHRLMDGSDAAKLQNAITELLENPMSILL